MRTLPLALASSILVLSAPVAAQAATNSKEDPARDGSKGPNLDVKAATLDNKAKVLKVTVGFEKVSKGDLIVFLKLRGHKLIRAVSEYRPGDGTLENYLLGGDDPEANADCPGFKAAWSTSDDTATLRIPSGCLDGGDYDEARFKILTEIGPDADLAPQAGDNDVWRWSKYAARG
jgi:hypothetical protein